MLRPIATLLVLSSTVFAASGFAVEVAELRNGFTIPHRSREMRDGSVRLYLDEAKKSFVDLPAEEIASYSSQPDLEPTPSLETPSPTTPSPATPPPAPPRQAMSPAPAPEVEPPTMGQVLNFEQPSRDE